MCSLEMRLVISIRARKRYFGADAAPKIVPNFSYTHAVLVWRILRPSRLSVAKGTPAQIEIDMELALAEP
jgi:hypothetical protein